MNKTLSVTAILVGLVAFSQNATASTYVVEESVSPYIHCYSKEYVPARVRVNTRGKLVRGTREYWQTGDTAWNVVRDPSVFIETRTVVEPDHYTLVPTSCPAYP